MDDTSKIKVLKLYTCFLLAYLTIVRTMKCNHFHVYPCHILGLSVLDRIRRIKYCDLYNIKSFESLFEKSVKSHYSKSKEAQISTINILVKNVWKHIISIYNEIKCLDDIHLSPHIETNLYDVKIHTMLPITRIFYITSLYDIFGSRPKIQKLINCDYFKLEFSIEDLIVLTKLSKDVVMLIISYSNKLERELVFKRLLSTENNIIDWFLL